MKVITYSSRFNLPSFAASAVLIREQLITRLDRYLSKRVGIKRKDVRLLLAQGRVEVDGERASDVGHIISAFSHVSVDGKISQNRVRRYLMLNKPAGVVSATVDTQHTTVIDLLTETTAQSCISSVGWILMPPGWCC